MCEAKKKKNRQKQQFRKKKVNDLVRRVNFGSLLIRSLFPTNTGRHVVQKGVKVKKNTCTGKEEVLFGSPRPRMVQPEICACANCYGKD